MRSQEIALPPPGIEIEPLVVTRFAGQYGLTGYEIKLYEVQDVAADAAAAVFKGGWGDADTVSCEALAMVAANEFGRAAIVSNRRLPCWNPMSPLAIFMAPLVRLEAIHAGIQVVHGKGSELVMVGGQ